MQILPSGLRPKPRVLVVDDDAAMRLLARASLSQAGFEVAEAENGIQALSAFVGLYPDIVLLDVMMPEMDGFAICSALRRLPGGEHTPVLMITGLDDVDSIDHAYEAGATDFVTKPINWVILRHRVRYMLRAGRTMAALRESEERYAAVALGANDGLWDWNLRTHTVFFSPRWKAMLGYSEQEIGTDSDEWLGRVHPDDISDVRAALSSHIEGLTPEFQSEHRILHRDGSYRWVLYRGLDLRDPQGKSYRIAGSQTDITRRKRAEEQLTYDALHDGLTGLANRALLNVQLEQAIAAAKRYERPVAVLFLDLDRFKDINDSLGHRTGDLLLQAVSARLKGTLRESDPVARFGGDEFVMVLADLRAAGDAAVVAEHLLDVLAKPFAVAGQALGITPSIGISVYPQDGANSDSLIKNADAAMYHAKKAGRNNYQFFMREMNVRALAAVSLANELRLALRRGEFILHYQPQFELARSRLVGAEALIRWQHPDRGLLLPREFIPFAEEQGLIIPIGEWVLHTACIQNRRWQTEGLPIVPVAVNISALQFQQKGFLQKVADTLLETGLQPHFLEIELTESILMHEAAAATVGQLRAMGLKLSIDDFGTGYSSLGYLRRFPIEKLKIDRSFINDMTTDPDAAAITRVIIGLAKSLNLRVIAEGVETQAQYALLRAQQCDEVQGYYFSRPLTADQFATMLSGLGADARSALQAG